MGARACCGAALAVLALGACDDTLPPIVDAGAADRGADGPADAREDAARPADRALADEGAEPRDLQRADRAPVPDGPQPVDACAPPSGGCFGDGDCKAANQVCSTSLGDCLPDPCCASCTVCYGKCVPKPTKLTAVIVDAKGYKETSSGSSSSVTAAAVVEFVNNYGATVNNVKLTQSVLLAANGGATLAVMFQPPPSFSGSLSAGQALSVDYESASSGVSVPFACQADVRVRTMVTYSVSGGAGTTEQIGPLLSPLFEFGCY